VVVSQPAVEIDYDALVLGRAELRAGLREIEDAAANCGIGFRSQLLLVDAASGEERWRAPVPYVLDGEVAIVDGVEGPIVVGASSGWKQLGGGGFALDLMSGAPLWQRDLLVGNTSFVVDDVVLEHGWSEGTVTAVDVESGYALWSRSGGLDVVGGVRHDQVSGDWTLHHDRGRRGRQPRRWQRCRPGLNA
jgi:outer membrane protein assembly factor BamB